MNPEVLTPMIAFYSCSLYHDFDRLGVQPVQEIARVANDISGEHALQHECNQDIEYRLPYLGECTPGKVLAAMVACIIWLQKKGGVDYFPDSPLLSAGLDGWKLYELLQREKPPV